MPSLHSVSRIALVVTVAGCQTAATNGDAFTALTADTHTPFPVASGDHAVDCNACHGSFDTFALFTCIEGCHGQSETDAIHGSLGDYAYVSTACYACHPTGTAEGIDHTNVFPIAQGDTHDPLTCSDCHRAALYAEVTCAAEGCHGVAATADAHGAVGGYSAGTDACLRCHAESQVDRVASHLPFRITAGSKHYRRACFACHTHARLDRPYLAMDTSVFGCDGSGCHSRSETDGHHRDVSGYAWNFPTCVNAGCHQDGSKE